MRYSFIIPFLLLIPILIFQAVVIQFISINEVVPDLILILLVYFTINNTQMYGTVVGFLFGAISDLTFGTILGSTMLAKTISGFVAGYFSSESKRESYLTPINFGLIIFLVGLIDNSVFSFFSSFDLSENFIYSLLTFTVLKSLYTTLFAVLIILIIPKRRAFE